MTSPKRTEDAARTAAIIAFTERGLALANRIADALGAARGAQRAWRADVSAGFGENKAPLAAWTTNAWGRADAVVFVGATGIAVRAIAPHVANKMTDPAVVVVNEGGTWAIPLLSGHVGGANRLATRIADTIGATAVVTTATDGRGLWAVDTWAAANGMTIANPSRIKAVSGALLAGSTLRVRSDVPIDGAPPRGVTMVDADPADVAVSPFTGDGETCDPLRLVPKCVRLGIGCHRNIDETAVEHAVESALSQANIDTASVSEVTSIDLKRDEAGLVAFCEKRGWPFTTYSADELSHVEGSVSPSAFVAKITGVDNVCERAALAEGGRLVLPKRAENGVTVAIAIIDARFSWSDPTMHIAAAGEDARRVGKETR